MSEAPDGAEHDATDEIDLSDVPMDDGAAPQGGERQEGEGGEGDAAAKAAAAAAERQELPPEELKKRYDNTRTALSEERRQRRELERRFEALERGETAPASKKEPAQERQEEDIDPDVDPVGALKQMRAKIAAYEQAERIQSQTEAQRQEQEAGFQRVERALSEHEADFKEDHPDYDDAAKHYAVTRAKELMQFGLNPGQIQPMLREEFVTLASTAIRAGKNPAAVVYEMAKGRGFGKKADEGKVEGAKPGKLDTLKTGAKATSPLARTAGRATTGLDVTTVANIDIHTQRGAEAFDRAWEALERRAKAAERSR